MRACERSQAQVPLMLSNIHSIQIALIPISPKLGVVHSTVTHLARFLGLSIGSPSLLAV
ncbi:MAG: hypothetical protein QG605_281 [Euryarchaeota archaeon]|jgi:hypothetical protein|nr:hypothetical protein [Euryarchaeota archaeon]